MENNELVIESIKEVDWQQVYRNPENKLCVLIGPFILVKANEEMFFNGLN
jgi:hypothetical protein